MVQESCKNLVSKDTADLIPYVDSLSSTESLDNKPELKSLMDARDQANQRLMNAVKELEKLRSTLTTTLWELNDLSHHPFQLPDAN